jgi:hypothetical protein
MFLSKLVGRSDIEDALVRLDKLTRDEVGLVAAQVLKSTHDVDDKVQGVSNQVQGVGNQVQAVDERVNTVLNSAYPISNVLSTQP